MEIDDATGTAGRNWNLWNINGLLALDAGTTPNSRFTLVLESGSDEDPGLAANFDDTSDYHWVIAETSTASAASIRPKSRSMQRPLPTTWAAAIFTFRRPATPSI